MRTRSFLYSLLFILSTSFVFPAFGQTMKEDSLLANKVGQVTINAGGGASMIYLLTQGILNGSGYITLYTGPVVSLIGDYRVTRRSSIGLGVAYQATNGTPGEGDDNPSPNESLREYITRTNVALRYMYQFSKSPYFDFYIGGRVGASFWTDNVGGLPNYGTLAMGHSFSVLPSIQILMGLQVYLADFFGLHIEAGVGSPYFAEGGLTIRIKNKVKSAKPTFPMHAKD